jgi:hypothetical protein
MTDFKEHGYASEFCFSSGKTARETFVMLKLAFGGNSEQE